MRSDAIIIVDNPTPELPDDTPIERVRFPTRIRNLLDAAGLKTVGDVREISDDTLVCTENLSSGVVVVKSAKDGV